MHCPAARPASGAARVPGIARQTLRPWRSSLATQSARECWPLQASRASAAERCRPPRSKSCKCRRNREVHRRSGGHSTGRGSAQVRVYGRLECPQGGRVPARCRVIRTRRRPRACAQGPCGRSGGRPGQHWSPARPRRLAPHVGAHAAPWARQPPRSRQLASWPYRASKQTRLTGLAGSPSRAVQRHAIGSRTIR